MSHPPSVSYVPFLSFSILLSPKLSDRLGRAACFLIYIDHRDPWYTSDSSPPWRTNSVISHWAWKTMASISQTTTVLRPEYLKLCAHKRTKPENLKPFIKISFIKKIKKTRYIQFLCWPFSLIGGAVCKEGEVKWGRYFCNNNSQMFTKRWQVLWAF